MTIQEALDQTWAKLKQARIPEPRLDAEYLVAEAAGIPRLRLALEKNRPFMPVAEYRLALWTRERLERRPLAYVLGEQPFMNLKIRVNPSVLVPRPETELLVEEAYRLLDNRRDAVVVDVGTGSGNIALSLACHPNVKEIHAIDISSAALDVAHENALRNTSSVQVEWHQGDLLTPILQKNIMVDLVVANLPYIRTKELSRLSPEVRWEPALALDGGQDGLAYISAVIEQAEKALQPQGILLLEIGFDQGPAVLKALTASAHWKDMQLYNDLAGLPRIIQAEKGVCVGSLND